MNYQTETDLCNAALSILGQGPIADATVVDASNKVLTQLQMWYAKAFEMVFRDINFETEVELVPGVMLLQDPFPQWRAAYYVDPLWINFIKVWSGIEPDNRATVVPHRKLRQKAVGAATSVTAIAAGSLAIPSVFTCAGQVNGTVVTIDNLVPAGTTNYVAGQKFVVMNATATTCQLGILDLPPDPTNFAANSTNAIPLYFSVAPAPNNTHLTPQKHYRIYCNLLPDADRRTGQSLPIFEIGSIPDVSLLPDDVAYAVAVKLAGLSGVGIVGIDHKADVDTISNVDYPKAKAQAIGTTHKESFKGTRPLSESTLSRLARRHGRIPGTRGVSSGFGSSTNP